MSWSKQKKYKKYAQCLTEEGITLLLITCYHCKLDSGRMGRNEPGNNEENYQVVRFESSNRWVKKKNSFIALRKMSLAKP